MRAIVPRHPAEAAETEIGLVHQRGRLERVAGPLRPQMARRDGAELGIDDRQELLQRAIVPQLPGPEILGDLVDG
jgi:hypothetical protein